MNSVLASVWGNGRWSSLKFGRALRTTRSVIPRPANTGEPMKHDQVEPSNPIFNNFKGDEYAQLNFEPLFWIKALTI